jgi:hypothetical protein
MMSSAENWTRRDGKFNLQKFYDNIVSLFELDERWANETLNWWNQYVYFIDRAD